MSATMNHQLQRARYTDEQREEALRLLAEVGKAEAARQTGIPSGTIGAWGSRSGVTAPEVLPLTDRARAAASATMAERKAKLAEQLEKLSTKAVAKLIEQIDADQLNGRELVAALTAGIDRMQLLTGDATSRPELTATGEPVQRRNLLSVVESLAERAKAS